MSANTFSKKSAYALAPRGDTPSLARLAYNRLGFGPLSASPDFNDLASLTAYVDAQLNPEAIDDSECENYVAGFNRTFTVTGTGGVSITTTLPPPDATLRQLQAWVASLPAGSSAVTYTARFLRAHTYMRAALSKRQLYEAMVDFWTNHFNTLADTTHTKYWEDNAVIRRFALGNFRDLLGASAKSPAMLNYLSNFANDGSNPNENYARELLELHTLGTTNKIPGDPNHGQPNYTEDDVHQVAYMLSGWTYTGSTANEFAFTPSMHNYAGRSLYLSAASPVYYPNGGIEQGEAVLDRLSEDPRTAYRLSLKLCQRFISDEPETFCPNVILAGQAAFLSSHGDIKTTLRAILLANFPGADFKSSFGQKIKRPFEFYASALRALGADTTSSAALFDIAQNGDLSTYTSTLDQILFGCPPPTGYPDVMDAWWSTNQLFARLSLSNRIIRFLFGELDSGNGVISPPANARLDAVLGVTNGTGPNASSAVDMLVQKFLGRSVAPNDRQSLITYLNISNNSANITSTNNRVRQLIGALLASPYFQYR